MRKMKSLFAMLGLMAVFSCATAADRGSADDAVALVKKGISLMQKSGKDNLIQEVNGKNPQVLDRDLYLSVWDLKANVLAHGANARMVGKDIIDLKDADGKAFMKEIVTKAASSNSGWVDYKWVDPISKEIQPKSAYFEKVNDTIVSSGYYKAK
ncbi:cache domain-containing protein [Noviherbaspirillum galbum]|uniref:Histidine kinase n=1 Tax=Noviherbaspirillum galbum TaxID=2709383 RepID=A0A6B3SS34_9BURK|nr:cache domain-containing protein [Noviherbaspirillum galbum]NEX62155.1 histidine kinase [Noviherbaspirillum galbum]